MPADQHQSVPNQNGGAIRASLFYTTMGIAFLVVALPIIAIILFAVFPKFNELSFTGAFSNFVPHLADPRLVSAVFNSVALALSVCAASTVIALFAALIRVKLGRRGVVWDVLFLIPFLIPPFTGAFAWIQLSQRNGFLEQLFGFNVSDFLFSFAGIVAVMALNLFPVVYFTTSSALQIVGQRYEEVARFYGAGAFRRLIRIVLPLIATAIVSSNLLVFILSVEEFGSVEILGRRAGLDFVVTYIHEKLTDWPIDLPGASVLSLILIAIALCAYLFHMRMTQQVTTSVDEVQAEARHSQWNRLWTILGHFVLAALAIIAVFLPLASIMASAMMQRMSAGLTLSNLNFSAFVTLFTSHGEAQAAILTSLELATVTALVTVVIGILTAFFIVRWRNALSGPLDFLMTLPNAIPAMTVAVGLILVWNQAFWPWTPYNTWWVMLLAYTCIMLPYPVRMISSTLRQLPMSMQDAAIVYGATDLGVIWRVNGPALLGVSLASGFIVFAIASRELVTSLLLTPPGFQTVSTFVFHQFDQGSVNIAMAMSIVSVVISGSFITLGNYLNSLRNRKGQ
ncbi:ABC transporter permease [Martelella mediterranea]|uniref:Iron(III) transport system permease protein n=1 Tax=Martelella mediterranea TaxID=293089 RepID=A0A4R3NVW2_9HYPH|nr:iron ABC transporter permease [Martelella mediterranea]TCT41828.1 iron(III) transport system permease protein [Martelella mediterranea]